MLGRTGASITLRIIHNIPKARERWVGVVESIAVCTTKLYVCISFLVLQAFVLLLTVNCAAPQFTPLSSAENELSNYGQQAVKCDLWGFCLHQAFMSTGHLHQFWFFVVAVAVLLSQMTLQP